MPSIEDSNAQNQGGDIEGPSTQVSSSGVQDSYYGNGYGNFGFNALMSSHHIHPNSRLRDKGYSIYVVDDEHEIHRFDIDTCEWSIVQTTKDTVESNSSIARR